MIVTKDTEYEPRKGLASLTRKERIDLAERQVSRLRKKKQPLEERLARLNNLITYWERVRLIELYHSTPVEKVKSHAPRKARSDKGFSRRKPTPEDVKEAFLKLSDEEKRKVIKRLSKTVTFQQFKVGGKEDGN